MKKVHRHAEVRIGDKRYPAQNAQKHGGIITFTAAVGGRAQTRCGSRGRQVYVTDDERCVTCRRCL